MFYDLILVVTSFRRSCHYLPIVKELSAHYRIGVYIYPLEQADFAKYQYQNKIFIDLICEFGATVVSGKDLSCNIVLLPQWHYRTEYVDKIFQDIECRVYYWDVALAMGNHSYENLNDNKIDKVLIVDADFYNFRLSKKPKEKDMKLTDDSIFVVGTPYIKYPVFDDLDFDYIIATPTPFSFPLLEDKVNYLDNVISLLADIPRDETIVYKPHNAIGIDSLVHPSVYKAVNYFRSNMVQNALYACVRLVGSLINMRFLKRLVLEYEIVNKHNKIMERVEHLRDITKYSDLNLEVFLPNVRKGLITGRSNSIWHALHARLPVYNCVSNETAEITGTLKKLAPMEVTTDKMHKFNMRYFNVGCCDGQLDFDPCKFMRVSERTRESNIVDFLIKELKIDD